MGISNGQVPWLATSPQIVQTYVACLFVQKAPFPIVEAPVFILQ
jgi:hypothetical protein